MPCMSKNQLKSGWSRAEYQAILNKIFSKKTDKKVIPLIIDDLVDEDLPLLLSNIKCVRYSETKAYKRLLLMLFP